MTEEHPSLAFDLTREDIVAFALHVSRKSATARRLNAAVLAVSATAGFLIPHGTNSGLGFRIAMALFLPAIYLLLNRTLSSWYIRRIHSEGRAQALLGAHRLILQPDSLRSETTSASSEFRYHVLEKIEDVPAHVFAFISGTSAVVIPKGRVTRGDLETFVALLRRNVERSKS
jgi:hypothetical protein